MPSLEQYMPLSTDKKKVGVISEAHKQRFLEAMAEYQKQIK